MPAQEESREEWEKEIIDVQHSVTFPEELRSAQIIAKKLSSTPAPIPDFAHFIRGILSSVLLAGAVAILSSNVPHKIWLSLGLLTAGIGVGATAFRWKR
ncbi:MAG: hypothetical protein WA172_03775 [Terriglobales bacterium]|jgi:hypothetical protein